VYADNLLIWPDGFRCFREELSPDFLRDGNYRVVVHNTDEWVKILSTPMFRPSLPPPPTGTMH